MASVELRTYSFEGFIKQIHEGILRVPRFQRQFVWRRDQILDFFDSVRQKYPVGSLLIWRTRDRYSSFSHVGPVAVPEDQPKSPAEVGYVLDGHQRTSVIFGVFALDDKLAATLSGKDGAFVVYYDLDTQRFIHARHPQSHHLPARYLLGNDDSLAQWLDERRDTTEPGTQQRETWDQFRRRATQVQTTFAQYRLPYLDITDASLNEAVKIFARVNSRGTPVRQEEIFAALTWRPDGFDFSQAASDLLSHYPRYRNFGTKPVFQSVLAALDEFIYDTNWDQLVRKHQAVLPSVVDTVGEAMGRALDFLGKKLGAASGKVVPYSIQIVLLTEFFRRCPTPSPEQEAGLKRWFWSTSFSTAYSSATDVQVMEALNQIQRLAAGEVDEALDDRLSLRPLPRRFHAKAARVRVFYLFLKTLKPRSLSTGEPLEPSRLLRNGMGDAPSIFKRDQRTYRLAGRLLVGSGRGPLADLRAVVNRHAQTSLVSADDATATPEVILRSHVISDAAAAALRDDELDAFLDIRHSDLVRAERDFAKRFVELGEQEVEDEAEVDVEEDEESDL